MKTVKNIIDCMFSELNKRSVEVPDISLGRAINLAEASINENTLKSTTALLKNDANLLKHKSTAANRAFNNADEKFKQSAAELTEAVIRVKVLKEMPDTDDQPADPSIPSEMKFAVEPSVVEPPVVEPPVVEPPTTEPPVVEPPANITVDGTINGVRITQEQITKMSDENADLKARLAKLSEILR
jgi:hypothetical protein